MSLLQQVQESLERYNFKNFQLTYINDDVIALNMRWFKSPINIIYGHLGYVIDGIMQNNGKGNGYGCEGYVCAQCCNTVDDVIKEIQEKLNYKITEMFAWKNKFHN